MAQGWLDRLKANRQTQPPVGWETSGSLGEMAPAAISPSTTKTNVGGPQFYSGGDPNATKVLDALRGLTGASAGGQTPTLPESPSMFRQEPPSMANMSESGTVPGEGVSGPRYSMERTPGGTGMGGNEWALANQGPSAGVRALTDMHRSSEELYRQAANPTQTVRRGAGFAGSEFLDKPESYTLSSTAPGASAAAMQELQTRQAPEDFQRLLGQKQEETIAGAGTQMRPDVSAAAEAEARRAAYPQQAQAEGAQTSALLNFLGRQKTAEGATQSQQIAATGRHITSITAAQQRLLSDLSTTDMEDEDRTLVMQQLDRMDKQKQALMQLQNEYGLTDEDLDALLEQDLNEFDTEDY